LAVTFNPQTLDGQSKTLGLYYSLFSIKNWNQNWHWCPGPDNMGQNAKTYSWCHPQEKKLPKIF